MIRSRVGVLLAVCVVLGPGGCARRDALPEGVDGEWQARRPSGSERIRLDLHRGPMGRRSTEHSRLWVGSGDIEGLDREAFRGEGKLEFRLERDAGTFHFEGLRQRRPQGSFRFEPSQDFLHRLEQLGLAGIGSDGLIRLAFHGVSEGFVAVLLASGYRDADADGLLRLHRDGLGAEWIAAMSRLQGPPSFRELTRLRNHGVRAHHVDRWLEAGLGDQSVDDLLRLHLRGLDPDDAARYRELGFADADVWLAFHRNGVPLDLIRAVVESDGPDVDEEGILRLYVHGARPGDIRDAAPLFAAGFDWEELVYLWRRGVDCAYAEALLATGWEGLEATDIVQLAAHGLDADWIARVRAAGGAELGVDELLRLRRHGVRAGDFEDYVRAGFAGTEEIRTLVAEGVDGAWIDAVRRHLGADIDVDELVRLRRSGVDERLLQRLDDAGFGSLDVDEVIEARRAGLERWVERRRP